MYKSKSSVDKHVEGLLSKLSEKEFKSRAYSFARLYYEAGDFSSCRNYVEQYLSQKDNNAAAHKLLGQALLKLGLKEKAFEQFKISLDLDPTQTSLVLDICELLADDEVFVDPGRAKYWCDKAEAIFPRHPITFKLRERLTRTSTSDPEALVSLLKSEISARPKDVILHVRLLKHYMQVNKIKEAFDHSCSTEFGSNSFLNNLTWYETVSEVLNNNLLTQTDWQYQLLLLTVKERITILSLTEVPSGSSKSILECCEILNQYDQAIEIVKKVGAPVNFNDFHLALLQHHYGQLSLHIATFILKKAKKDQINWKDATKIAGPMMLISWHTVPLDVKVNWLQYQPEYIKTAVSRWYYEGAFRCSQAGHYIISNMQDNSQSFLNNVSNTTSATNWKESFYETIFSSKEFLAKIKSSYFVLNATSPILRLPRKSEVEAYDIDAQRYNPSSLHYVIWILLHYKKYADFQCSIFSMMKPKSHNYLVSGPETLDEIDILSFLYSSSLSSENKNVGQISNIHPQKPKVLPVYITDLLCTLVQMKWWDCAYKFSQNQIGTELTDIRATLTRGIEVIRCVDNHGLNPELLCQLGRIFKEKSLQSNSTNINQKKCLEARAALYFSAAIPILEKIKKKQLIKFPEKRMFDYTNKEMHSTVLNEYIEESKINVAAYYINDSKYEKAIELLSSLKSPEAYFYLSRAYKQIAEENCNESSGDAKSKNTSLLIKAKNFAYKSIDGIKKMQDFHKQPLYTEIQKLIENIEIVINKLDPDHSLINANDIDGKYSSDENISSVESEYVLSHTNAYRNMSSTPKHQSVIYRTAVESQMFDNSKAEHKYLDKIESQIKKGDDSAQYYMQQSKSWFDEMKNLKNQIMDSIHSNCKSVTEQFETLKISVDDVKEQIIECRNDCKDIGDLKRQISDLKKEITKLKKGTPERKQDGPNQNQIDDSYKGGGEATAHFGAQLPFNPAQLIPPFNQRLIPPFPFSPNPYLYGQNLYNYYNQFQFSQTGTLPGASQLFEPGRSPLNYSGVYPPADQIYPDVSHLVPPVIPTTTIPPVPTIPVPTIPIPVANPVTVPPVINPVTSGKSKDTTRSLPVNVVITSSDPLPATTSAPQQVLSVTIPPKHIKAPHNYQIPLPTANSQIMTAKISNARNENSVVPVANLTAREFSGWNSTPDSSVQSIGGIFETPKIGSCNRSSGATELFVSPNNSFNKSRTLSEKSNTSVENYDPCPDFKPIVPLPAEVTVTTGEEEESIIFCARAKLFRFVEKEWKERGLGEMKLLKHKLTGKVRVLMRREQVHKICANHIITSEIEIQPMKNETKAYCWVANDFADEKLVLERFCIRFKTPEIAKQFYDAFEMARKETKSSTDSPTAVKSNEVKDSVPVKETPIVTNVIQPPKTNLGGFTFTGTPNFNTAADDKKEVKLNESSQAKVNPFSSFTFKTNSESPFSKPFNSIADNNIPNITSSPITQETSKLNNSDVVEEFEPTIEFQPVIPLPALVEHKTGEEDEDILFEHRAKLLRYDASAKEWKERGLGIIKLLSQKKDPNKLRLLMRREQVMKVCCNHVVTKEMTFEKMPKVAKAVTWCAKDFSEGELVSETFCLRFKTIEVCDDFLSSVKLAQTKISSDLKADTKEKSPQLTANTGFGDKFKPKAGSWECNACFVRNESSVDHCSACNSAKDPTASKKESNKAPDAPKFSFGIPSQIKSIPSNTTLNINDKPSSQSGFGDKFKPKAGSWECNACFVRNESSVDHCSACNSAKDPAASKKENNKPPDAPKFNFGIPSQIKTNPSGTSGNTINKNDKPISQIGFGDKFKPKSGSWECEACFVRNDASVDFCSACNNPKDATATKKESLLSWDAPKFKFGIPTETPMKAEDLSTPKTCTLDTTKPAQPIFGNAAMKFSFGVNNFNGDDKSKSDSKPASIFDTIGTPKLSFGQNQNESPLNVSSQPTGVIFATPTKPSNTQNPSKFILKNNEDLSVTISKGNANEKQSDVLSGKGSDKFQFIFKPKETAITPVKSPKNEKGEESDGNEYASDDEGHHIHFSPVIPLPDKVKVVTGEENEDELYAHRAKLFRFVGGEWKERGLGTLKILRHKETGKLRVLMRREQILKICLNHVLTPEVMYTPKDEKSWMFVANDFSEGELCLQNFCLRFKNKEIAEEFVKAVENARQGNITLPTASESDNDDVIFVDEIQATPEEKQKAKELMLPENFFTYKNHPSCPGCRGCLSDEDTDTKSQSQSAKPIVYTPMKFGSPSTNFSPANSTFHTPANFKSNETSLFQTPLQSSNSNNVGSIFSTANKLFGSFDNKENSVKTSLEGNAKEDKTESTATSENQPSTLNKGFRLPEPKLKNVPQISNTNTGFGFSGQGIFSNTSTNSNGLFSFSNENKPTNAANSFFSSGKSIFQKSTESDASKTSVFNITPNVDNNQTSVENKDKPLMTNIFSLAKNEPTIKSENVKQTPFSIDNNLSFAALSSAGTAFSTQKKDNFQWEGAGTKLFVAKPKGDGEQNKSRSEHDETGDEKSGVAEEEYDPHYEPIVPLPDKIVVTTGEEDEEKLFGERCKLYRYDEAKKEWKERGVGELKILYHPEKKTYRLILRREQVHKAVLNMLVFMDLELLPMKNSDRAWTWAGLNYAENAAGDQELLAVRFKTKPLADQFHEALVQCTRKLQAAAAQEIREAKEEPASLLRLPKHLEGKARADPFLQSQADQIVQAANITNTTESSEADQPSPVEDSTEDYNEEEDEDAYDEHDYEGYEHYNDYYEENDDSAVYYIGEGKITIEGGSASIECPTSQLQVMYDMEISAPKILVTDATTGEILADVLIDTETEFELNNCECSWTAKDYLHEPVDKTFTVQFPDVNAAISFYDSCETTKMTASE